MAENHINTAFGALGTLDVILRRCMEGFGFWQRVNNFAESVEVFKVRLDFQRAKLAFWAQEWGIETKHYLKDRRFRTYEASVINYLTFIHRIINDLGRPDLVIPTPSAFQELVSMEALPRFCQLRNPASVDFCGAEGAHARSNRSRPSLEGVKWALNDERSKESLALLTTLIQDLYDFLPPPYFDAAGAVVLSTSLASQDANTLARVGLAMDSTPLQAGLAWLKSIAYRTQAVSYGADVTTPRLDESKLVPSNKDKNTLRFLANYEGSIVFVEQKHSTVPRNKENQRVILDARIENIAMRLQDPRKPAELRTLPCKGIGIRKTMNDESFTSIYSIVYRVEASQFFSLREILRQKGKTKADIQRHREYLSLGRRFLIAQTLSRAVMYLHLADWLHKAIRSENVLFFATDTASLKAALPYLVGFEYSRPDAYEEQTENVTEKDDDKFYRHPKAQAIPLAEFREPLGGAGRYSKIYDIYSIGVVLVELGCAASARHIVARHMGSKHDPTPEEIRNVFIEKAVPELRFSVGDVYANATRICINGFFDKFDKECLGAAFYTNVVRQLELCNA